MLDYCSLLQGLVVWRESGVSLFVFVVCCCPTICADLRGAGPASLDPASIPQPWSYIYRSMPLATVLCLLVHAPSHGLISTGPCPQPRSCIYWSMPPAMVLYIDTSPCPQPWSNIYRSMPPAMVQHLPVHAHSHGPTSTGPCPQPYPALASHRGPAPRSPQEDVRSLVSCHPHAEDTPLLPSHFGV